MTQRDHPTQTTLDAALSILADRYRRRLLLALLEHNPQDDDDPQIPGDVDVEAEDLEAIEIAIRHSHLPKLEDAGLVEWDRERNAVRKGPRFDEIRPLLELMRNHADELPDDWL